MTESQQQRQDKWEFLVFTNLNSTEVEIIKSICLNQKT